jgi:hypothetical protein
MEEIRKLQREQENLAQLALLRSQDYSPVKKERFGDNFKISMPNVSQKSQKKIKEVGFERRIFLDLNDKEQDPPRAEKPEIIEENKDHKEVCPMPGPVAKVVIQQIKPPVIQNLANISENENRNKIIAKNDSWENFETPQDQVDQPVVEFG